MEITCPTLLLDIQKCKNNIQRMANKAKQNNVEFRPHFKTHQSHEIGQWFHEVGVDKITVSSVRMAHYFAKDGWKDISIAFPTNILEVTEINDLASKINLNILIESKKVFEFVEQNLKAEVGVFIKIDAGYHRTGISVENKDEINELISCFKQSGRCKFKGFLVHNGHTYKAASIAEIKQIHFEAMIKLKALKERYLHTYPELTLSLGDTPSMSVVDDFKDIDEIRPGNFVFYDLMQSQLGVCSENDISVIVACPVVAKHKSRNQIVIYGGGVHLSKESIKVDNQTIFGKMLRLENNKWTIPTQSYYLKSISQEHGILQLDEQLMKEIKIGQLLGILPVHSCLAADLYDSYLTMNSGIISKL